MAILLCLSVSLCLLHWEVWDSLYLVSNSAQATVLTGRIVFVHSIELQLAEKVFNKLNKQTYIFSQKMLYFHTSK